MKYTNSNTCDEPQKHATLFLAVTLAFFKAIFTVFTVRLHCKSLLAMQTAVIAMADLSVCPLHSSVLSR